MAPPSTPSTARQVHRLVEHYASQGTLGRLLLGAVAGMGGVFSLLPFLAGTLALVGGVATAVVGIVTLWPVYLSLIGNIDSPADYPGGAATVRDRSTVSGDESSGTADLDAEELLKRHYAAGDLAREEYRAPTRHPPRRGRTAAVRARASTGTGAGSRAGVNASGLRPRRRRGRRHRSSVRRRPNRGTA